MGYWGYDAKDIPPPKFGKTPLELFTDKTIDPPSISSEYGFQTGMASMAAGCQALKNWVYRRPMISGIQYYPIFFVGGFIAAHLFRQYRLNYFAERDAVYRHYIELHPEDFPAPARKKYSEVLLDWTPIR